MTTYCFDIDGTLCTNPKNGKFYEEAQPRQDRIAKVNDLYDRGHIVIIESARGSDSGKNWLSFTIDQLRKWGVKYHAIRVGHKMSADIYIDDRAQPPHEFFVNSSSLYTKLITDPKIIFDIGIGKGTEADGLLQLFPGALLYGFDGYPNIYAHLLKRHPLRLRLVRSAVGDYDGITEFNIITSTNSSSLLDLSTSQYTESKSKIEQVITVPICTLDTFCTQNQINRIDILHLDAQGSEIRILKGAERLLSEQRIGFITAELNYYPYYEGQCWPDEVSALLRQYDYYMRFIFPSVHGPLLTYADGIFLPKELAFKFLAGKQTREAWA